MRPTNAQATINLYLDKRTTKGKDNTHPIKIRVTYKRETQYLNTSYSLSETDFKKLSVERVYGNLRDMKVALNAELTKANHVIDHMQSFNFTEFKKNMGITASTRSLSWYFDFYVAKLLDEERLRTGESYQTAHNNFKKFYGGKFSFQHITPSELLKFETDFIEHGKSASTVGVYMRCLRAIYNVALEANAIAKSDYPFGRNKYVIPTTKKRKVGIAKDFIKEIHEYQFELPIHNFYKDLWLFSFHCNGLNMKDIAFLKYINLNQSTIAFIREKSVRTRKAHQEEISVGLNRNAREILSRWGNEDKQKTNYIFPILEHGMDLKKQYRVYMQVTHMAGEMVKKIAKEKEWTFLPTFITARHSYGNLLQKSDQPLHVIQKAFGHADPKTTMHYLSNLKEEKLDELAALTEF